MLIDFWNEILPILFILPFSLWFRKCLKWENFGEIDKQIIDIFHPSWTIQFTVKMNELFSYTFDGWWFETCNSLESTPMYHLSLENQEK